MKQLRLDTAILWLLSIFFLACHKHDVHPGPAPIPPAIPFSKLYGGSNDDKAYKTVRTSDGGYLLLGQTYSSDSGITNFHGATDILVVSVDINGNRKWTKCFGGSADETPNALAATSDGGFLISGYTESTDGDVTGNHGNGDVWVLKIDANGNKLWAKCLGGSYTDAPYGMVVNADGTFALAVQTGSNDGDIVGNHGFNDACLIKLDANGNKVFAKCYGGTQNDGVDNIVSTSDGYIISGETMSSDGDMTQNRGNYDVFLVKVDGNGNKQWVKTYGGSGVDQNTYGLVRDQDGTIALAAASTSNDGEVQGNHGSTDIWFLKLAADGTVLKSKCYGGTASDYPSDLVITPTGYAIVGVTTSTDGDVSGNHGNWDAFLLTLDNAGNKQSFTCFGGTGIDAFNQILATDKTFVLTGCTNSNDGNVTDHPKGGYDFWIHNIAQ